MIGRLWRGRGCGEDGNVERAGVVVVDFLGGGGAGFFFVGGGG